ncbi:MAG: heterodisulfide reductase-related iron-sulfur binding cluster [Pseudomonadota bacterium]
MQPKNIFKSLIVFLFFIVLTLTSAQATEYYSFHMAGSDCTMCHEDVSGGELNDVGTQFEENGYRFPITQKEILFYALSGLAMLAIFFGLFRRYKLWSRGRPGAKLDRIAKRWDGLFVNVFGQNKILKNSLAGQGHLLLFWSFTLLGIAVIFILIQEYIVLPLWGVRLINSYFYPFFRLFLDIAGLIGLIGAIILAYRRYIIKPKELDDNPDDGLSLLFLIVVFLTGFLATGIRNQLYQSEWTNWAPVASSLAWVLKLVVREEDGLKVCFNVLWWIHSLSGLIFLAAIPYSRLLHAFTSSINIFCRNLEPKGALPVIDIASSETYGAGKINDFTFKHLLELDACTQCGRCQENCPALISEKHLNPKSIVQNLKKHMEASSASNSAALIGGPVTDEEIWECTTCLNCIEHCPVFIEPMLKIVEMRRNAVLEKSNFPGEFKQIFKNLEIFGDPKGKGKVTREGWVSNLKINRIYQKDSSPPEILFWAGCIGAIYDERSKSTTNAVAKIFQKAGVSFGILGKEEFCCGDPARRIGNEYLFQKLALKNIETMKKYGVKKLVTHCPHCFNTFKNEYPALGADFEVIEIFEFIKTLLDQGKLEVKSKIEESFTYHDPCYLGRYNLVYETPRDILKSHIGVNLTEMERIKETSFCCGAGGGNMWRGVSAGKRMENLRIQEAVKTEVKGIVTACPHCDIMFDSAIQQEGMGYTFKLVNLIELVKQAVL